MYKELYAAWQREISEASLGVLPPDFYQKIAAYLQRISEENKQQDKKTAKVNLLEHEAKNVNLMLKELLSLRYRKILKNISKSQRVPAELLTVEEVKMSETFADFAESYQKFIKSLLAGQQMEQSPTAAVPVVKIITSHTETPQAQQQLTQKRLTVRFVKNIPAIMGADMKSYGPFAAEDVASLPALNAQILIKQGLAVLVEVS
jgi:DNA replication factor GINS